MSKQQEPQQPQQPVLLTVEDVAARLRVSKNAVYGLTRRRIQKTPPLPTRRIGKFIRVLSSDLDAWILALPVRGVRG